MKHLRYTAFLISAIVWSLNARAEMAVLHYKVGNVAFTEDSEKIRVQSERPITIDILPGGRAWPPLQLDESGHIFAGSTVIDPSTGKFAASATSASTIMLPNGLAVDVNKSGYELRHGQTRCTMPYQRLGAPRDRTPFEALQSANVKLTASNDTILALVTSFLKDGQTVRYKLHHIDPRTCKISAAVKLGDPDLLIELGRSSRGGWWLTGSVEQTLMVSKDGTKWRRVKLPTDLSALSSSYVVDEKQIWLAAILGDMDEHPNLIVYSPDGGKSWISLKKNDPLLEKIPKGWLEGQKRRAY